MAPELYIPSCIREPAHPFHPPPLGKPLRIQIEGPLVSVKKLLPDTPWHVSYILTSFPQIAGPLLAKLTFEKIYGHPVRPDVEGDLVVRDEYLGWVREVRPRNEIDYYGVTFDHLVPADDPNPEVLQININEMDDDEGAYANKYLPFAIPTDYISDGPLAARFGVGYLDGRQPSLVAYMKNRKDDGDFNLLMSAWSFSGTALKMQWKWRRESRDAPDGHSTRIIDVDGDGRDEVHESGFTLHGDGQLRYSLGPQGVVHGDRFHIA
ncbi:hypothetical protein VdG2_06821 [Verticillium dahliae VDG2]|nr:hypothetical protein VdG2_06821 [Verticillium dahliae VDG2]